MPTAGSLTSKSRKLCRSDASSNFHRGGLCSFTMLVFWGVLTPLSLSQLMNLWDSLEHMAWLAMQDQQHGQ